MPRLLIVHHTASPALHALFEAVMSGATDKQITGVDVVSRPALEATARRPYGLYVHGNNDTTGAVLAIEKITTGLQWQRAQQPVEVCGPPTQSQLDACWELGAALAAGLTLG